MLAVDMPPLKITVQLRTVWHWALLKGSWFVIVNIKIKEVSFNTVDKVHCSLSVWMSEAHIKMWLGLLWIGTFRVCYSFPPSRSSIQIEEKVLYTKSKIRLLKIAGNEFGHNISILTYTITFVGIELTFQSNLTNSGTYLLCFLDSICLP